MTTAPFDFTPLLPPGLPPAAPRWTGRIKYDFTGGNNDPDALPLDGLIAAARVFPTFCDAVIERRDPLLAERLLAAFEAGGACAFVGITHIPGVAARLRAAGCEVAALSPRV